MEKQMDEKAGNLSRTPTYEELATRVKELEEELKLTQKKESLPGRDDCAGQTCARLMRRMLDNAPDLIWAKDMEDRYLFANKGICRKLLKCGSNNEAVGKTDLFFAMRERAGGYEHTFGEICLDSDAIVKETSTPERFLEYGLVRGKNLVLDVHKAPFYNSSGEMIGTVGCGRDVTKEKEAQDALERATKVLREIAGDVDGIAVQGYDEQRMVTLWNKASEGLYGYSKEEALGKKLEDLIIPERMREGVIRAHERWLTYGERIPSGELVLKSKTGKDVHVYSSHSLQQTAVGKEMFCIDIDLSPIKKAEEEKRLLYEQLEKAQKMEAIGTLAGGIAHDFNNILSAITGYAELASNELPKGSSAAEDIALLLQASKRAAELVKQILTFSRKTPQDKRPLRAQLIVKEAMNMMRSSLPSTIDIKTSYSVHREMIIADPTGVHQVVVNLCTNALYAMKDQKGKLCISLELEEVDRRRVAGEWEVESGTYVVLGVEDNGHGMDEKILSQIFEPYFTTKERGDGTGLGLAMVHGIVKRCRGFIEVRSSPGEGTCFQVYFPLYKKTEKGSADVFVDTPLPRGNEHILFVDDEAALCHIAQSILSGLGYQVTTETESLSALERFREDPYGFDLVISDQTMPQLTGVDLAGKILALRPEVPFLLCTGYSSAVTKEAVLNMGIRQFIEKPLSRRALAESVRQVLDTPVK